MPFKVDIDQMYFSTAPLAPLVVDAAASVVGGQQLTRAELDSTSRRAMEYWQQREPHYSPTTFEAIEFEIVHMAYPYLGLAYPAQNRIQLDITGRSEQIACIHRKRGKAALPEVTAPFHALVDRAGIPAVHMIRHQAIGPDVDASLPALLLQGGQVKPIIRFFKECLLAAVAALGDMVRVAGYHHPGESCQISLHVELQYKSIE